MSVKDFENFFKSTIRVAGQRLWNEGKVVLSHPSDTEISAFIKASGGFKVFLKCQSVSDKTLLVDCSCPSSKKGQLCKHVWAVFLEADKKAAEFFDGKTNVQKKSFAEPPKFSSRSQTQSDSKAAFKVRQQAYRKEQYQKQKQKMKDFKQAKKKAQEPTPSVPNAIEAALKFFSQNGFPMENNWNKELVGAARKKLSRIFHPDVGGTHAEIVELNTHAETLLKYFESQK